MKDRILYSGFALCLVSVLTLFLLPSPSIPQSATEIPNLMPGQSATLLPDDRWLILGGQSSNGRSLSMAEIWDPQAGVSTPLSNELQHARAYHSATILPDGTVFIFGGVGRDGQVLGVPEIFDPATQSFTLLSPQSSSLSTPLTARAKHTATLLTDGTLLIAGGVGPAGEALGTGELFDPPHSSSVVLHLPLSVPRKDHTASLLSDGRVLLSGGTDGSGAAIESVELFDPGKQTFTSVPQSEFQVAEASSPYLVDSLPTNAAVDIPIDDLIALRFSRPLRVGTVNSQTVILSGPKGVEPVKVVPAEGGMLAFITPEVPLLSGATYTVTLNGAVDRDDLLLPLSGFSFTTEQSPVSGQPSGQTTSQPETSPQPSTLSSQQLDDWDWRGDLRDGKPYSPWQDLPPLQAEPGVTALAGQALDVKGEPLVNVTVQIGYGSYEISAQTDDSGRFLLRNIEPGWRKLLIDGRLAQRKVGPQSSVLGPPQNHGVFEYGLDIKQGETNALPFTIWLPKIDSAHAVKIPSPTTSEVVVATPKIPGLELRIPPNTVIYDHEQKVVTEVSLTAIPLDRTPFPLPNNVEVPIYFTAQPGGAYIYGPGRAGARVIYPNYVKELPGARFNFWHYSAGPSGWYIYGMGTVTEDGKQVVPDAGVSIYEFTGAMINDGNTPPEEGPHCGNQGASRGDPVDLCTGLFLLDKTDLFLPDVMPISLARTYRTRDTNSRPFGIGMTHPYAIFLWSALQYQQADLILPDGGRIHYVRISPGVGFTDAEFEHTATPSKFHKSRIKWNVGIRGWDLTLKDGTLYHFGENTPLQYIQDRYGNQITITRTGGTFGNITKITSPNGRWIEFTYDTSNRITQARDNIGRAVTYTYDAGGRLWKVTDANGGITEHTYDASHRMLTVKDSKGNIVVTNEYDASGRVIRQTLANTGTYQFAYTTDTNGKIIQTDVTDPRGNVERVTFNTDGYTLTQTKALGKPEEQTITFERQTGTNLLLSETDGLGRKTAYTYDSKGSLLTATRLFGTPEAVTTTYTYEPTFNQVASIKDPLNHTTTFGYDPKGNLTSVTNPLNQTTTFTYNAAGQPVSIKDPLNNTTQFAYDAGDLVAMTDPLANITNRFVDAAGRLLSLSNPLGNLTRYDYDLLNRLTKVTDALGGMTNFGYDANGNLLSVTDAKSQPTIYTYNNMDRLETRKDPLLRQESYVYDNNGNLSQFTDRKSQPTTYTYDALNRRTGATYADTSTTTYTYDKGNRLLQVNDSVSGIITRTYDGLDRLTSESTPQGSVSYIYDAAGRRTSMTSSGQPSVVYSYDNANRLLQITQGSSIVLFGYDAAGRRTSLTLPNGILVEYTYDPASRVTEIKYKQGVTVLGNLTHEYDKASNRTKVGGSFARSGIPQSVSSTNYNAANHQTIFGDKTLTYDNNGNLTSIVDTNGTTLYSWNARNQLVGISGPGVNASFVYDSLGRREKKTINGSLTEFLYDGVNPVQETSGATVLANILTGLGIDEFFSRADIPAAMTSHFLPDALGSAIALADSAGTLQTEYTYEPFGKTTVTGLSSSSPFQFTGRENDGTDIYHYRARYYHPGVQRFIGEDPILSAGNPNYPFSVPHLLENPLMLHPYAYVGNNPINFVDPTGLQQEACTPKRDCEKELVDALGLCAVERNLCGIAIQAICRRTGPLIQACIRLLARNLCNPIFRNCGLAAQARYTECLASQ